MSKHYVCSECKTESSSMGTCDNEDCIQQGAARKECSCEDGLHKDVVNEWNEEDKPFEGAKENTIDLDNSTSL